MVKPIQERVDSINQEDFTLTAEAAEDQFKLVRIYPAPRPPIPESFIHVHVEHVDDEA